MDESPVRGEDDPTVHLPQKSGPEVGHGLAACKVPALPVHEDILEASEACLLAQSPVAQAQVDFQQGAQLWWQGDAQLDSMPSAAAPKSAKELLARINWCKHGRLVACTWLLDHCIACRS